MYQSPGSIPPPRRWWSTRTDPPKQRPSDWWRLAALLLVGIVLGILGAPWNLTQPVPLGSALLLLGTLSGAVAEVLPLRWRRGSTILRLGEFGLILIATLLLISVVLLG